MARLASHAAWLLLCLTVSRSEYLSSDLFPESGDDCSETFCFGNELLSADFPIPPPPLPSFMRAILNDSFEDCNLCRTLSDGLVIDGEEQGIALPAPRPNDKSTAASDGMTSVLVASILGLTFGASLLGLIWCKKWRHFGPSDSCPVLPDRCMGGHRKSVPPPPSPTQSVLSPVVNEKSPQSIIMDHGTGKRSVIQTKYWRRGSDFTIDPNSSVLRPVRSHNDHYGDGSSCTSSPVYAELDGTGAPIGMQGLAGSALLMSGSSSSISPYALGMNTYSELPDNMMRMTNITNMASSSAASAAGQSPASSYDNAAYLPNINPEAYGLRSLRRPRSGVSGQPLLQYDSQTVRHIVPSPAHVSGNSRKGSRRQQANLVQQLARKNVQRMQEIDQAIEDLSTSDRLQYCTSRRHASPAAAAQSFTESPSMTTFKSSSPYALYTDRSRDRDPKRPLPPVPGVRL